MKVINLFGGPGSGKSTTAAGLFYKMKLHHLSVELVTEYAKDLVYSDRLASMLDQQEYIFAKQNHQLHRLRDKVDWVVTDSPTLLASVYVQDEWPCVEKFKDLVRCSYHTYDNINVYLRRPNEFQEYGRAHNLEQSKELDTSIIDMLQAENIIYDAFDVDEHIVDNLFEELVRPQVLQG
jgi:ATP:corrinoid adenosyltransferase